MINSRAGVGVVDFQFAFVEIIRILLQKSAGRGHAHLGPVGADTDTRGRPMDLWMLNEVMVRVADMSRVAGQFAVFREGHQVPQRDRGEACDVRVGLGGFGPGFEGFVDVWVGGVGADAGAERAIAAEAGTGFLEGLGEGFVLGA